MVSITTIGSSVTPVAFCPAGLLQDARAREAQRAAQARLVSGTAAMDIARDLIARANERREEGTP